MPGLTEVFGGSTVQPSNVAYSAVSLSATIQTQWPPFATGTTQPLARLMDVAASSAGLSVKLPDATLAGKGQDVFFNNTGSNSYSVTDVGGNAIATIAAGQQRYIYLTDNSTSNGSWRSMLFGVGASSPDASQLAGYGVKAIGSTLNQASITQTLAANYSFLVSDRAGLFVNTGGGITGTLPLTSLTGADFVIEARNQGAGIFTLSPSGGELIDGATNITLQLNESCTIHSGTGAWYTVGRGRNTQFNFTQLVKPLTGGTTVLSLTEASNVVQTYNGTATSNNILVLPSVVQVYYISNNILGGYTLLMKTSGVGATLGLAYGQSAVVFCDGVNVVNASTSVGGITALLLAAGSRSAPSLAISTTNNGLFAPTGSTLAVSAGGVEAVRWSGAQTLAPTGTVGAPSLSFAAYSGSGFYASAANEISLSINGTQLEANASTGKTLKGNLVFGSGVTFPANMTMAQLLSATGAPKADGTGATGTWGIDISGNAATAAAAATAGNAAQLGGVAAAGYARSGANTDITSLDGVLVGKGAGSIATNTRYGATSLGANTTGSNNTAVGSNALSSVTTGYSCTAVGSSALKLATGYGNSAFGASALASAVSGVNNAALGRDALATLTTGSFNVAIGSGSQTAFQAANNNVSIGATAMAGSGGPSTGSDNTAIGTAAMAIVSTGSYNVAIGESSCAHVTSGSGNTDINPLTSAGAFAPAFDISTQNNRISLGSTAVTNAYVQVAWTVVSDARDKTNFAPVPHGLEFVNALNPTAYQYTLSRDDQTPNGPVRYGFKAQDVLALEGDSPVIVDAEDAEKLRFNDQSLIAVLVNAVKELSTTVTAQTVRIEALEARL